MVKITLRKRSIKLALVVILSAALGLAAWRMWGPKAERAQFSTTPVERGMIINSVSASGEVLSANIISVSTKASGTVSRVFVKDGDQVKKGDKIMEITLDLQGEQKYAQARASYLSAKNSLESAKLTKLTLEAAQVTARDNFIRQAVDAGLGADHPTYIEKHLSWQVAEAKYQNQDAAITQAQVSLTNAWLAYQQAAPLITAPADGTITSLTFAEGMPIGTLDTGNTTSNQNAAMIRTVGNPILSVNISEIDVPKMKTGQKAVVVFDSLPDQTFSGAVVTVDRMGQTTSGVTQYPAVIRLDSSPESVLPNMAATATIVLARKDSVLLVPTSALQTEGTQSSVNVLKNGQPQTIPVKTGLSSDTQTEIVSGLNEGDQVITGNLSATTSTSGGSSPFGGNRGFGQMMVRSR